MTTGVGVGGDRDRKREAGVIVPASDGMVPISDGTIVPTSDPAYVAASEGAADISISRSNSSRVGARVGADGFLI